MTYKKDPEVSWRSIEGQAVLIHNRKGEVQVLNEIGTYVWEHLEDGVPAIVTELSRIYNSDASTIQVDVEDFIRDLEKAGVISA